MFEDDVAVLKFGGSSLNDLSGVKRCASIISKCFEQHKKIVCVLSAMGTQTDLLLGKARELSDFPEKRELDMLLTTGERVSCALMSIALQTLGHKAVSITGSQCGIITDKCHGSATIKHIEGFRLRKYLKTHDIILVAGFQGVSEQGKEITTLGRGGSDLTAVALATHLKAKDCLIYTDVPGVMTADPRVVPSAETVSNVNWHDMQKLASYGAKVLHPRAALLSQRSKMPLKVLSSLDLGSAYSTVNGDAIKMESSYVVGVAHKKKQSLWQFNVSKASCKNFIASFCKLIHEDNDPIYIRQNSFNQDRYILECLVPSCLDSVIVKGVKKLEHSGLIFTQKKQSQEALISIVGGGLHRLFCVVDEIFSSLDCPVSFSDMRDDTIQVLIAEKYLDECISEIHTKIRSLHLFCL